MPTSTTSELVITDAVCSGFSRGGSFRLEVGVISETLVSRNSDSDTVNRPTWTSPVRMYGTKRYVAVYLLLTIAFFQKYT